VLSSALSPIIKKEYKRWVIYFHREGRKEDKLGYKYHQACVVTPYRGLGSFRAKYYQVSLLQQWNNNNGRRRRARLNKESSRKRLQLSRSYAPPYI
jgi:hypothetical protein